jgi:hypothetical protein
MGVLMPPKPKRKLKVVKGYTVQESDQLRLDDLAKQHRFSYTKRSAVFYFWDTPVPQDPLTEVPIYIAYALTEALAFAEGFDRAKSQSK